MSVLHNPLPEPISGIPVPDTKVLATPVCRCCGSLRTRSRGKLPNARVFAGSQLDEPLAGGTLYRCLDCRFMFRHPVFGKETYDELYRQASSTTWDEADRLDQQLVRETLCSLLHSGKVLDVGCGTGSLLAPLSKRFQTFGIEINADAALKAGERGVPTIARDLDELSAVTDEFDAIIACDVIEHVFNPLEFVQRMLDKTAPKGYVVISTGNTDAWSWYLAGSRFWYCFLPEHISFVSPGWFRHHAATLGVQVAAVREFAYSPHYPLTGKALRLALMALFRLSPGLYYRLLPRIKRNNIPVGRGITQDHFIIVLRKLPE